MEVSKAFDVVRKCLEVQKLDQDAIRKVLDADKGGDEISLLYGESPLESIRGVIDTINEILGDKKLKGDGTETFVDIGSGRGHAVSHWKKCSGIELLQAHVDEAEKAKLKLAEMEKEDPKNKLPTESGAIEFICADAITDETAAAVLRESSLVFCFDLAFPLSLRRQLSAALAEHLEEGALLLSVHSERLPSADFCPVGPMFTIAMEWGYTPVQLYRKGPGAFEHWLEKHESQLVSAGVPKTLWAKACVKLIEQELDIGEMAQFAMVDEGNQNDLVMVAKEPMAAESDIFVLDHCWSFASLDDARSSLSQVPGLKDCLLSMCIQQQPSKANAENSNKDDTGIVLEASKSLLASYMVVKNPSEPEKQTPVYYMLDEIGSRIRRRVSGSVKQFHQGRPANFRLVPIFSFAQRMAFSLAFPINHVDSGEVLIADHEQGWDMDNVDVDIVKSITHSDSDGSAIMPEMKEYAAQARLKQLIAKENARN